MFRAKAAISKGMVVTMAVSLVIVVAITGYATINSFENQPSSITCSESASTFSVMENGTGQGVEFTIPAQPCAHEIGLHGFTLTARANSGDLNGTISINSSSQLEGLIVYVNGTYEVYTALAGSRAKQYAIEYNTPLSNNNLLITSGTNYFVEFVAIFKDGTASTASTVVRAS